MNMLVPWRVFQVVFPGGKSSFSFMSNPRFLVRQDGRGVSLQIAELVLQPTDQPKVQGNPSYPPKATPPKK